MQLEELADVPGISGVWLTPDARSPAGQIDAVALAGTGEPDPAGPFLLLATEAPSEPPPGCAAMVVREASPESPVPAFVLAPEVAWIDAIAALREAVDGPGWLSARTAARHELRQLASVEATAEDVASCASALLDSPVVILDEHLDVLGAAGASLEQRETLTAAVEAARGHGPASPIGVFERTALDGAVKRVIRRGREPVGSVVSWIVDTSPGPWQAVLEEIDSAVLGMRSRDAVRLDTEAQLKGDFIEELSAAEPLSAEVVVRRARHLGCDLSRGGVVLLGALHDPHNEGRLITDPRLVRRFLQRVRSVIALKRPGALVHWKGDTLVLLLPPPADTASPKETQREHDAKLVGERILDATSETVSGVALTLAMSRFTPDPARLGTAIEEARLAYSIGDRLGTRGGLVTFEHTGAYRLLFRVLADRPQEMVAFFEETILPVIDYDSTNRTDLARTLATYLDHDGNLAATAAELFTHRHTVRYRLDRIHDLTGLNISRSDDREMLSLGLKAMRLLGRALPDPVEEDVPADGP